MSGSYPSAVQQYFVYVEITSTVRADPKHTGSILVIQPFVGFVVIFS
jgi:hypothetical protein